MKFVDLLDSLKGRLRPHYHWLLRYCCGGSCLLPARRADYKSTWNRAGRTHHKAMLAVVGYDKPDEFSRSGKSTAETILRSLQISPEHIVLEIGCGLGRIGYALAPSCKRWIGADISSNMLEYAGKLLSELDNVELRELDGCNLKSFSDATIDRVYCSTVFMHLDEWDRFAYVKESFRVLVPGGLAFFDNLNLMGEEGWRVFSEMAAIDARSRPANISKASTASELMVYLSRAGFVDISVEEGPLYVSVTGRKPLGG